MLTKVLPMDALVAWVLNYAFAGPVATALGAVQWGSTRGWAAHGALRLAAVFLLIVWLKLVRGVDLTDLKALFRVTRRVIGVGAVVGLAFFAFEYLTVVAIQLIDRQPNLVDGTWNPWVATRSLAEPTVVFLLVLAVVGPLVEEFVHRGVAYPALRSRIGSHSDLAHRTVQVPHAGDRGAPGSQSQRRGRGVVLASPVRRSGNVRGMNRLRDANVQMACW